MDSNIYCSVCNDKINPVSNINNTCTECSELICSECICMNGNCNLCHREKLDSTCMYCNNSIIGDIGTICRLHEICETCAGYNQVCSGCHQKYDYIEDYYLKSDKVVIECHAELHSECDCHLTNTTYVDVYTLPKKLVAYIHKYVLSQSDIIIYYEKTINGDNCVQITDIFEYTESNLKTRYGKLHVPMYKSSSYVYYGDTLVNSYEYNIWDVNIDDFFDIYDSTMEKYMENAFLINNSITLDILKHLKTCTIKDIYPSGIIYPEYQKSLNKLNSQRRKVDPIEMLLDRLIKKNKIQYG